MSDYDELQRLRRQVKRLLDACERTGVREYKVGSTEQFNREVVELHELVGRCP